MTFDYVREKEWIAQHRKEMRLRFARLRYYNRLLRIMNGGSSL